MWSEKVLLFIGCILHTHSVFGLWYCRQDSDCSTLVGSTCSGGACLCPLGQQSVLGGTLCADVAPYHTSSCVEDHQCSRLVTTFECRRENGSQGDCSCQSGNHYLFGRCWRTANYGDPCTRTEECLGVLRDPFSLTCDGTCGCADGYYTRQREECRRIASAVGDGCVLDEDCHFPGGACDITTFSCYDINEDSSSNHTEVRTQTATFYDDLTSSRYGSSCDAISGCWEPYVCTEQGVCVCPIGYYAEDGVCLAELGSPSTVEQCKGLFAVVTDGVCTCPANFYFEENMRDCVKATRRITDSCLTDANCHTFGAAARCGPPQEPWPLRTCECIPEEAVWDGTRDICRLFAGIGESCEVDSDCLAGELEIHCILDSYGNGTCACPEGFIADGGLCLTTGLALGDSCQATQECTETANTVCDGGRCSCGDGYQEVEDYCAPIIGGTCFEDSDCVIENTVCFNNTNELTCQCDSEFIEYDEVCWPAVSGHGSSCNTSAQCTSALGAASSCVDGVCACSHSHHYRDGGCWQVTGIFEICSRTSQCYLSDLSERLICRNGLCQCDFNFPYSEALHTCTSSATNIMGSLSVTLIAIMYLYLS